MSNYTNSEFKIVEKLIKETFQNKTPCNNVDEKVPVRTPQEQPAIVAISDNLIGVEKLSQYLDVPEDTIRDWVYRRKIPFIKLGRLIRFRLKPDILRWIDKGRKDADRKI